MWGENVSLDPVAKYFIVFVERLLIQAVKGVWSVSLDDLQVYHLLRRDCPLLAVFDFSIKIDEPKLI